MQQRIGTGLLVTIVVVVVGIVAFIANLSDIWLGLYNEGFIQFSQKRGWVLDMRLLYPSLLLVLGIVLLALQIFIVKALCQIGRWDRVHWLEQLAQGDSKNMKRLVSSEFGNFSATLDLSSKSPHAMFYVHVVNNSIYPLTIEEKVDRRITFDGIPLEEAYIYWPPGAIPNAVAKPRDRYSFAVIQRLPQSVVDSIQSRERYAFGAEGVAVWFTYRDYAGIVGRLQIDIGSRVTFPKG